MVINQALFHISMFMNVTIKQLRMIVKESLSSNVIDARERFKQRKEREDNKKFINDIEKISSFTNDVDRDKELTRSFGKGNEQTF